MTKCQEDFNLPFSEYTHICFHWHTRYVCQ